METQEYQNLVQTLMSNHLAASASEAQRMAKEMLGTSEKVQNDAKKKQHYMISGFKPQSEHVSQATGRPDVDMSTGLPTQSSNSQIAVEPQQQQSPLQPETKTSMPDPAQSQGSAFFNQNPMQNKIDELRERAINPEPVNVQVDFQTPNMDNQQNINNHMDKTSPSQETTDSLSSQNSDQSGQSDIANMQSQNLSPEEYSANKFGNNSLNNLQSDFLSLKTPQQSEPTNNMSADWPAQQPQQTPELTTANNMPSSVPNQFNTSTTQQETQVQHNKPEPVQNNGMVQNFQKEAIEEKTQEIVSEKKESKWTPEEEKLKNEVDLTRVFNFSNK